MKKVMINRLMNITGKFIGGEKGFQVDTWIATICVIFLLVISIMPIRIGRSDTEIYLCSLIIALSLIGSFTIHIRKVKFQFNWIDSLVIGWYTYVMSRLWFDTTYPAVGFAIRATLICMLYVAMRILMSGCRLSGNSIAILLVIFAIVEAGVGYSQIISGTSRHHLYYVTGSFLNPGPYSAYLTLGIVCLCSFMKLNNGSSLLNQNLDDQNLTLGSQNSKVLIFCDTSRPCFDKHTKDFGLLHFARSQQRKSTVTMLRGYKSIWLDKRFLDVLLILLVIPLVLTMSRAAFLAILICLIILFHRKIKGWKQWGILLAVTSLCIVCFYFMKSGSADGRGIINYIGFHCFADNPIWGSGIGCFFHRFALKTAEISMRIPNFSLFSVDVIDYAFNDLLPIGVEQGLVGLSFVVSLIYTVLSKLWYSCRTLFIAILSLLIISLFSYPFELLPYQIICVIITSFAATNKETVTAGKRSSLYYAILTNTAVLAIICWISYICNNAVCERMERENKYHTFAGLRDKVFTNEYYSLLPYLQENIHFLFDFSKILSEQGRYNESNDILRRGVLISNDPMFLVLQGNNYRHMEAYELAEQAYIQAWHTMPNRIYPLYQLMKLHKQLGNTEMAKNYAIKILKFKEKIHSPAVNDFKREAIILYQNEL